MIVAALVLAVLGAIAGFAIRKLLARLPRGAIIQSGTLEVSAAAACGLTGLIGWPDSGLILTVWAALLMVALSAVDLKHHRLPDAITLPAIPISALLVLGCAVVAPESGSPARAVAAGAALGGVFLAIAYLAPRAMGRGDAKLVISLGILLGYHSWAAVLIALASAFVLGAVVGLLATIAGRMTLKSALPFGPFLLVSCWAVLLWPEIVRYVVG